MKHDYNNFIEEYNKNGFVIVDNLLPKEIANKLESTYTKDGNEWEFNDQYRDQGYSKGKYGKSYTNSSYFPGVEEAYTAKFWRSNKLEVESVI